jgi:hypothetical protein
MTRTVISQPSDGSDSDPERPAELRYGLFHLSKALARRKSGVPDCLAVPSGRGKEGVLETIFLRASGSRSAARLAGAAVPHSR